MMLLLAPKREVEWLPSSGLTTFLFLTGADVKDSEREPMPENSGGASMH